MSFAPTPHPSLHFRNRVKWGQLVCTPFDLGTWALLAPAGQQNHAPQLCWVDPKTLACVWMAGGQEGTCSMSIYASTLRFGKNKWSAPKLISQNPDCSEQNPLVYTTQDGRVHLIHTAQTARDPLDESWKNGNSTFSMQWTAKLFHQSASSWGARWSRAKELIPEPAFCRNPPFVKASGDMLLPIYRSLEDGGGFGHDNSIVLTLNKTSGLPTSSDAVNVPMSKGRVQGSIVSTSDGKGLLQFFRSRLADKVYMSTSDLEGKHWTEPVPTMLPNNNSSIQAVRMSDGMLAVIFNRFGLERPADYEMPWGESEWPRTRWPLSIAISADDGNTFPWVRDIDTGYGFCGSDNWHMNGQLAYPSMVEGLPGSLHIAYSWGGRAAIRYCCINIGEIVGQ